MSYITIRENFLDDVKNRVQRNIGNAADAVHGAMDSVENFGQNIKDSADKVQSTITNIGQGIKNAADTVHNGVSGFSKLVGANKGVREKVKEDEEDDEEDFDESGMPFINKMKTTSLIKRQIPNGKINTTQPISDVRITKKFGGGSNGVN